MNSRSGPLYPAFASRHASVPSVLSAWRRLVFCLLLLTGCLDEVEAASLRDWPAIDVAELPERVDLLPQMALLREEFAEPSSVAEIIDRSDWQTAGSNPVGSPFKPATLWLAVPLVNHSEQTITRVVSAGPWRTAGTRVSVWDETADAALTRAEFGWALMSGSPPYGLKPKLDLVLPPGERRLLILQLRDNTIGTVDVELLAPDLALRVTRQGFAAQAVLWSSFVLVALLLLARGNASSGLAAGYLILVVNFELSYEGWFVPALFPWMLPYYVPVIIATAGFGLACFVLWSVVAFRARPGRLWRGLLGLWLVAIAGLVIASLLSTEYHLIRQAAVWVLLAGFVAWPVMLFSAGPTIHRYRKTLVFLFAACWLLHSWRLAVAGNLASEPTGGWLWVFPIVTGYLTLFSLLAISRLEELERQRAVGRRLEKARQRELAGNLSAGIVHDINNLITVLSLDVRYLRDSAETMDAAGRRQVLDEINDVTEQISTLTGGILLIGGGQPIPIDAIDPEEQVTAVVTMIRGALPADIHLEVRKTSSLNRIASNRTALQLVLLNLLFNARDAMPEGGRIRIELSELPAGGPVAVDVGQVPSGGFVRLSVCDTGPGMDEGLRTRLFGTLVSTKPPGRGHGLGLFMVGQFVERTGGGLGIESTPGRGTCMHLLLPRQPEVSGGQLSLTGE